MGVQSRLKGVNYLLKYDLYYSEILSSKCTISENVVFEKWYFTTNDESRANQHWYHNEWRGGAESWVMISMLICKWWVMSCEISFLKNHIFRNFISIFYIRSWTICKNINISYLSSNYREVIIFVIDFLFWVHILAWYFVNFDSLLDNKVK